MQRRPRSRLFRNAALVLCVSLLPGLAQAQSISLKPQTIAASAAAAADWATTYHALKYYRLREANPLLRPLSGSPGPLVSIGGAIDVAAVSAWNLSLGRSRPQAAAAGLWAMAAFRSYLAIHNLVNERKAAKR